MKLTLWALFAIPVFVGYLALCAVNEGTGWLIRLIDRIMQRIESALFGA